jgi:hypothetical protein
LCFAGVFAAAGAKGGGSSNDYFYKSGIWSFYLNIRK